VIFMTKGRIFAASSSMILMAALAATTMLQTAAAQTAEKANEAGAKAGAPAAPAQGEPTAQGFTIKMPPALPALVHYEAVNPGETFGGGDKLALPRQIAAAVVAQDTPSPKMIVDVGSFTGEFLEAFMEKFPAARGQWTEPVDGNRVNAQRRFARFGDRLDYVIGCPSRDISKGCVPKNVDVLLTSWLTIHQNREGIYKFYKEAAEMLPSGGWIANLDHIAYADPDWTNRMKTARLEFFQVTEGPPIHHPDYKVMTLDDHLNAFKAAGFDDVQVVWQSFNTVLFMARKK